MSKTDVIVIGSGFAGLMAAAVSVQRGKKVKILTNGSGSFPLNSGLIDIMGYPDSRRACSSPKAGIDILPDTHPYKKIGSEAIAAAMDFFIKLTQEEGYPYQGSLAEQQWVPTALGTMKPSGLVPKSMQGQCCFSEKEILVAGFKELKDYYPEVIIENLKTVLGTEKNYTACVLETELGGGRDLTTVDIARWLETEAGFDNFCRQIRSNLPKDSVVILPPVFGTKPSCDIFERLQRELSCRFVESTGLPPSPTGLRLQKMLHAYLRRHQVEIIENVKVMGSLTEGRRCTGVFVRNAAREQLHEADDFILATGGFYGGGLQMQVFGEVKETIFSVPVKFAATEETWANEELISGSPQLFAKIGIDTDARLRPIGTDGKCHLENVFTAGRNLSGYDFCYEQSGNGVALVSAYQAAMSI